MKWAIVDFDVGGRRRSRRPGTRRRHDGDWCYSDGLHLSIEGPTIITPAAQEDREATYSRHNFSYTPRHRPSRVRDSSSPWCW